VTIWVGWPLRVVAWVIVAEPVVRDSDSDGVLLFWATATPARRQRRREESNMGGRRGGRLRGL